MNPTDPMTPVRALIEAAQAFDDDRKRLGGVGLNQSAATAQAAFSAIPSISQLLSEHDALIEEIRLTSELADSMNADCEKLAREHVRQIAKRLQSIVEGK